VLALAVIGCGFLVFYPLMQIADALRDLADQLEADESPRRSIWHDR